MATTYRQDIERYNEIEVGDTVTYHVDQIVRISERFRRFDPVPAGPPYGEHVKEEEILRRVGGYYLTGKVVGGSAEEGWVIKKSGSKKADPLVHVDRENFWALRKAPGKGGADRRFAHDDAVVSCQICGGAWIGNTGKTPHHGYTRPGWGVQTNSCPGALRLPYAVIKGFGQQIPDPLGKALMIGRDVLPAVIDSYIAQINSETERLAMLRAGGPDEFMGINEGKPYGWNEKKDNPKRKPMLRGTKGYDYTNDYDLRLLHEIRSSENEIRALNKEADMMRQRYEDWLPGGDGILIALAKHENQ